MFSIITNAIHSYFWINQSLYQLKEKYEELEFLFLKSISFHPGKNVLIFVSFIKTNKSNENLLYSTFLISFCIGCRFYGNELNELLSERPFYIMLEFIRCIYPTLLHWAGWDTSLIFKLSATDLNTEFSFF